MTMSGESDMAGGRAGDPRVVLQELDTVPGSVHQDDDCDGGDGDGLLAVYLDLPLTADSDGGARKVGHRLVFPYHLVR